MSNKVKKLKDGRPISHALDALRSVSSRLRERGLELSKSENADWLEIRSLQDESPVARLAKKNLVGLSYKEILTKLATVLPDEGAGNETSK